VLASEGIAAPDFSAVLAQASRIEAETRFALASTLLLRGRRADAIGMLHTICGRWPDFAAARVMLAEQLLQSQQFDACREVLAYFPQVHAAGIWRDVAEGMLAYGREDWPAALDCLGRVAAAGSAPINAHAWLGRIHARQGDDERAALAFEAAAAQQPGDAGNWDRLGQARARQHRPADAALAFGRAVSLAAPSAALLNRLASAWDAAGEGALAATARARAMQLDPRAVAGALMR
jgi:tetratricopeptide (TPR) repeat protein